VVAGVGSLARSLEGAASIGPMTQARASPRLTDGNRAALAAVRDRARVDRSEQLRRIARLLDGTGDRSRSSSSTRPGGRMRCAMQVRMSW
jgi:hypothetical protein